MRKRRVHYLIRKKRLRLIAFITFSAGIAFLITSIVFFVPKHLEPEEATIISKTTAASYAPMESAAGFPSASIMSVAPPKDPVTCAKEARGKNKDVVGWIRIEGMSVDYPVVQTKDNEYYLTHDAERTNNKRGAIFFDYRCDSNSLKGNNILYGHHMKDGSMFASLIQYKDEAFFKSHPTIEFATLEKTYQWEIFAVFVTDTNYDYIQTEFTDKDEYGSFIKTMQKKSIFKTDISLNNSDDILILSTCTYEFDDARFVVAARREQ